MDYLFWQRKNSSVSSDLKQPLLAQLPKWPKKANLFCKFGWGSFCSILCGDGASGDLNDTLKTYSKLKVILFPLNIYQNSLSPLDLKVFLRACHYSMHTRTWILEHMLLLDQIEEEKTSRLKLHNGAQNLSKVVFEQVWTYWTISDKFSKPILTRLDQFEHFQVWKISNKFWKVYANL